MPAAPSVPASLVLGGGCFWCFDAAFQLLPGVTRVTCGDAGGTVDQPAYEQVSTDTTGHAEVVKIDYDPARISLGRLLEFFWQVHNPTLVNGEGEDRGTRYRSVIFYADAAQQTAAAASRATEQAGLTAPIATEILPLMKFWPAEDYHQNYFAKHPERAYCAAVIKPKVRKLQATLAARAEVRG